MQGNILKINPHSQDHLKTLKYDSVNRAKFFTSIMKRLCFVFFVEQNSFPRRFFVIMFDNSYKMLTYIIKQTYKQAKFTKHDP